MRTACQARATARNGEIGPLPYDSSIPPLTPPAPEHFYSIASSHRATSPSPRINDRSRAEAMPFPHAGGLPVWYPKRPFWTWALPADNITVSARNRRCPGTQGWSPPRAHDDPGGRSDEGRLACGGTGDDRSGPAALVTRFRPRQAPRPSGNSTVAHVVRAGQGSYRSVVVERAGYAVGAWAILRLLGAEALVLFGESRIGGVVCLRR